LSKDKIKTDNEWGEHKHQNNMGYSFYICPSHLHTREALEIIYARNSSSRLSRRSP
jgi:hypothetical protein